MAVAASKPPRPPITHHCNALVVWEWKHGLKLRLERPILLLTWDRVENMDAAHQAVGKIPEDCTS
jgi:hypothetical protein